MVKDLLWRTKTWGKLCAKGENFAIENVCVCGCVWHLWNFTKCFRFARQCSQSQTLELCTAPRPKAISSPSPHNSTLANMPASLTSCSQRNENRNAELHNSQNMRKKQDWKKRNTLKGKWLLTVVQDGEVSFHSCITHRPTEFPNLLLISSTTPRKSGFGVLALLGGLGDALTEALIRADVCSRPESANVLHKEPESKYFRLREPCNLCCKDSTLPPYYENSHRQHRNQWP